MLIRTDRIRPESPGYPVILRSNNSLDRLNETSENTSSKGGDGMTVNYFLFYRYTRQKI